MKGEDCSRRGPLRPLRGHLPLKGEDFAVEGSLVGPHRPFGPPPPEGEDSGVRGRTLGQVASSVSV